MAQADKVLQQGGEVAPARAHGDNAPQPVRSLRDWLDHLAARDRLVVLKPGIGLRFELAAARREVEVKRIALTMAQVRRHRPPPNFAKQSAPSCPPTCGSSAPISAGSSMRSAPPSSTAW